MTTLDPRRPFSRAEAVAAGISPPLLRGPRFRRIFYGVYLDASVAVTPMVRVAAALVPFPASAFASHASAARVHEVPIPTLPEEHVTVLDPAHRRHRDGIRCRLRSSASVVVVAGIRVSSCCQMFVELAELVSLVDLVVVGDHLVRTGRTTPEELVAFCAASDLPAATAALAAARFVRRNVDSPMETRLRMLLVLAGLPEPEINLVLRDERGNPVRMHDLTYRRSRTVIEYDGRHHVERQSQWEHDVRRREATDDDGIRMLVVLAKDVYVRPEQTLHRIWRVLEERGEPGLPARLTDDWRPHFPGRAGAA